MKSLKIFTSLALFLGAMSVTAADLGPAPTMGTNQQEVIENLEGANRKTLEDWTRMFAENHMQKTGAPTGSSRDVGGVLELLTTAEDRERFRDGLAERVSFVVLLRHDPKMYNDALASIRELYGERTNASQSWVNDLATDLQKRAPVLDSE